MRPGAYYHAWNEIRATLIKEDYERHLESFSGPVMFLNGSLDVREAVSRLILMVNPERLTKRVTLRKFQEKKWLDATEQGELRIIEGAGHLMLLDDRFISDCNQCILEFSNNCDWGDDIPPPPLRDKEVQIEPISIELDDSVLPAVNIENGESSEEQVDPNREARADIGGSPVRSNKFSYMEQVEDDEYDATERSNFI